jgi:hypothetical protein
LWYTNRNFLIGLFTKVLTKPPTESLLLKLLKACGINELLLSQINNFLINKIASEKLETRSVSL